jgi:hypothetical protein
MECKSSKFSGVNDENKIVLLVFLSSIMVVSSFLNSLALVSYYKLRKKIIADHIKAQIFIINLLFTLVAIPYYLLKEFDLFKSLLFCKLFYSVSDSIMFVYNNLLILMAFDRFFVICTQIRYKLQRMLKLFYLISFLVACLSLFRLVANTCDNIGFKNLKIIFSLKTYNNSHIASMSSFEEDGLNSIYDHVLRIFNLKPEELWYIREHLLVFYNFAIMFVISVNYFASLFLYTYIVRHVYKKTINRTPVVENNKNDTSSFLFFLKLNSTKKSIIQETSKKEGNENENLTLEYNLATSNSPFLAKDNSSSCDNKENKTKRVLNRFAYKNAIKKSKHWKITKIFIKVYFQ